MIEMRIPSHIRELENFGVGYFSANQIAEKVSVIKQVAEERGAIDNPSISIVIPTFSEEKRILGTLMSLAQQISRKCEVIIVNNEINEKNTTSEIAEGVGFCTVVHESVKGIGRARQTGLEAASGEIVVTTDADTLHMPDWILGIENSFKEEDIALSVGDYSLFDPKWSLKMIKGFMRTCRSVESIFTSKWSDPGSPGFNTAFVRSVLNDLGGYDVNKMSGEDSCVGGRLREVNPLVGLHAPVFVSARRWNSEGYRRCIKTAVTKRLGKPIKTNPTALYADYR